jgi:hypothetical protein
LRIPTEQARMSAVRLKRDATTLRSAGPGRGHADGGRNHYGGGEPAEGHLGTAASPLITALQNSALIGSSGVKLSTAPTQVANAIVP